MYFVVESVLRWIGPEGVCGCWLPRASWEIIRDVHGAIVSHSMPHQSLQFATPELVVCHSRACSLPHQSSQSVAAN